MPFAPWSLVAARAHFYIPMRASSRDRLIRAEQKDGGLGVIRAQTIALLAPGRPELHRNFTLQEAADALEVAAELKELLADQV